MLRQIGSVDNAVQVILKMSVRTVHDNGCTIKPVTTPTTNVREWKYLQARAVIVTHDGQIIKPKTLSLTRRKSYRRCKAFFRRQVLSSEFGSAARLTVSRLLFGHSATKWSTVCLTRFQLKSKVPVNVNVTPSSFQEHGTEINTSGQSNSAKAESNL